MIRRKGELSAAGDRSGLAAPDRVAGKGKQGRWLQGDSRLLQELSICPRGHSVFHDGEWFHVYCFAEPKDAAKFMQRFGGETFDPKQRGKGNNWARWKK